MKKPWLAALTFLALTLSAVSPTSAEAQPATAVAARIGSEIVVGERSESGLSISWGTAVGVVDAPIAEVMEIVRDYAGYSEFMPHFRTSRILRERGNRAMLYLEVGVLRDAHTLWGNIRLDAAERGETRTVTARMQRGNMDDFRARWEVTPIDANRTLVRFRILVDPDLPIPSSLMTQQNVKAARKTIRALRRRIAAA